MAILPYCKDVGRAYHPGYYLYVAEDSNETLASGLFEIKADSVETVDYRGVDAEDFSLFDGILRAGFNYAGEQGIPKGFIPEGFRAQHKDMFDKLNYPNESSFSIENFFSKYKNCDIM